jgi:hypothetical protein
MPARGEAKKDSIRDTILLYDFGCKLKHLKLETGGVRT